MTQFARLMVACLVIALAACAATGPYARESQQLLRKLSNDPAGTAHFTATWRVGIDSKSTRTRVTAVVQVSGQKIVVVALDDMGIVLSTANADHGKVEWHIGAAAARTPLSALPFDLEAAYLPLHVLAGALPASWQVKQSSRTRTLYHAGHVVKRIVYGSTIRPDEALWTQPVRLHDLDTGYTLTVNAVSFKRS